MWAFSDDTPGVTNMVTMPVDGTVTVSVPEGVKTKAFINAKEESLSHLHVKMGDVVHFEVSNPYGKTGEVSLEFQGTKSYLKMAGFPAKKGNNMMLDNPVNLFAGGNRDGMGGALGGGLGAGLLGGVLGGALLGGNGNGNGLFGNRNNGGGVAIDPWQNQANMSLMATLGDIKASIPLAEAQTAQQISASTAATGNIVRQVSDGIMANLNMQTQMNQKGFTDNTAATVAAGNNNLLATKDAATQALQSSWLLNQAISNDGDKTRALIQSIDKTNDSRMITELANQVTELRNEGRLRGVEGNITISNNNTATATAQQQQAQQQAQQIAYLSSQLASLIQQNQHIQQGVLNIGSGTVSGNSQTAANTRVS